VNPLNPRKSAANDEQPVENVIVFMDQLSSFRPAGAEIVTVFMK